MLTISCSILIPRTMESVIYPNFSTRVLRYCYARFVLGNETELLRFESPWAYVNMQFEWVIVQPERPP